MLYEVITIIKRSITGGRQLATYAELKALAGDKSISSLIDRNEDDYISLAELRLFNLNPDNKALRLQGMITPETVTHDFRTLENRWDCTFCHASGPSARVITSYSIHYTKLYDESRFEQALSRGS